MLPPTGSTIDICVGHVRHAPGRAVRIAAIKVDEIAIGGLIRRGRRQPETGEHQRNPH
jgi:hypothetical protein